MGRIRIGGSMYIRRIFVVLVFGFLLAGCQNVPQEVLLDSFEGEINVKTVDCGAADGSSVKVEAAADIKVCGDQALKIEYKL